MRIAQKIVTERPQQMKKLFFLHIPKCAGMSLLEAVKQAVPRNQIYQSSSMILNHYENYPEFFENSSFSKLGVLFGHWLHEDMLKIVPGNFLLATSLRDPIARIKSQYRFDIRRSLKSKFKLEDGTEFLTTNRNVICKFLCDAFPSIARDYTSKAEGAIAILSGFDFVYDSSKSNHAVPNLFKQLGLELLQIQKINTTADIDLNIDVTEQDIRATVEDDIMVYETFLSAAAKNPNALNPLYNPNIAEQINKERNSAFSPISLVNYLGRAFAEEIINHLEPQKELDKINWEIQYLQSVEQHVKNKIR